MALTVAEKQARDLAIKEMAQSLRDSSPSNIRLDDNESIISARQLIDIEEQAYDMEYPELKAKKYLYIKNRGVGLEKVGYKMKTVVAKAKFATDDPNDIPFVNESQKEFSLDTKEMVLGYRYTWKELQKAGRGNYSLDSSLLMDCRDGIEEFIDDNLWFGNVEAGVKGLLDESRLSLFNEVNLTADGTGSSKLFKDKTPSKIRRDVFKLLARTTTKGIIRASHLLVTPDILDLLQETLNSDNDFGTQSLYDYITKVKNVIIDDVAKFKTIEFENHPFTGKSLMLAFNNAVNFINGEITDDFRIHPAEKDLLCYKGVTTAEVAGVAIRQPKSIYYCTEQEA